MDNNKIVFVILHYITIEDTIKCVESIKKLNYADKEIVIVDNNSNNNTGNELKKKYKEDKKVHIILSKENLGFAKGNNLGFKYAKEKLNADFIVLCNNDIYMLQNDFCESIIEEYKYSGFAVLGPRIILNNNNICTFEQKMKTIKEYKRIKKRTQIFYYLNKLYLRYLYAIIYRFIRIFEKKEIIDTSIRKEDVLLNGCCLIFSRKYIDKFDGLDDRTFLYYEEQLLYIRIKKAKLKTIYNPFIIIFHNEGVATNNLIKNKRKIFDFKLKNEIDSLSILINEISKK